MTTWWLSFSSEGRGHLGVVLVDVETFEEALTITHREHINPGGAVASFAMTPELRAAVEDEDLQRFDQLPRRRLMSADEVRRRGVDIAKVQS